MELACSARQPTVHLVTLPIQPNATTASISTEQQAMVHALLATTSLIVGVAATLITPNVVAVNKGMP